ncbi:flocculation FLO11-like [Lecanosticta acicola]|uniref:Flocculation FLO11-like n=1 Tax=Lecanosticta acicola TaxID=111012 RepID=A0AAI8Z8L3_9PEZI|nr:flocculation FLO11-like [Lecanosticta acicola]
MSMPPLVREDGASETSSISSPPLSPPQDVIAVAPRAPDQRPPQYPAEGVVTASGTPAHTIAAQNTAAHNANASLPNANADPPAPAKPKRQRKAKENKDDRPAVDEKPKRGRKPREPKIKHEPPSTTAAASRKRQKTEDKSAVARQSTLTEMVNHFPPPAVPASAPRHQQSYPSSPQPPPPRPQHTTSTDAGLRSSLPPYASNPPTPRPISSGQNYDPIRGATRDSAPPARTSMPSTTNGTHSSQPSPHINPASASPSIISLIDPQPSTKTSAATMPSHSPTMQPQHQQQPPPFVASQHSPTPSRPPPTLTPAMSAPPHSNQSIPIPKQAMDGARDIDGPACKSAQPEVRVPHSKSSSSAPTPKPIPARASSPPKATGSGLLSSSDLFGGPSSNQGAERRGVDIEIQIKLDPAGGNTINMAQEIAKRYGRDAINPRAAAHRERLFQVAAAANKLEGGSADDMSVDLMSEADGDSNVEMGGMDEEKSTTDDPKPRKRRKKVEEYDKEDDFIDDTELAWQEQAAVAKDGFFVYSGPLVREGEKAQVDSATGTTGRGRGGRGRGRGRAAANAAASGGATHASVAEKNATTTGRGRGRGRGTGAPRKPRITKADRERMEAEKAERERMGNPGASAMLAPPTLQVQQQTTSTPTGPATAAYYGAQQTAVAQ